MRKDRTMLRTLGFSIALFMVSAFLGSVLAQNQEPIRVGIVGVDTSHAVAFTEILNNPDNNNHVPGARVVAAYPGGSDDIAASYERLPRFRQTLEEKYGIEIVSSIPELLERVDAVLLESVDGRKHLPQAREIFKARVPVFIDKPLAADLEDARRIIELAKEGDVPFFSSSSLRFFHGIQRLISNEEIGPIRGADVYSPASLEPNHVDLTWYGIHGVESLYAVMGRGCQSVTRFFHPDGEVVVGIWEDGRIGTFRGLRETATGYGVRVIGEKEIDVSDPLDGSLYKGLVEQIVSFFQTGVPPVPAEETLEMFEFMQAAQLSKERGGVSVSLDEVR